MADGGGPSCDEDGYYSTVQYIWTGDFYCQSKNGSFDSFAYSNNIENYYDIASFIKKVIILF